MKDERVSVKQAAKELGMSMLTVRGLMMEKSLNIGYVLKRPGAKRWGFYIYRGLLDKEKERLGV